MATYGKCAKCERLITIVRQSTCRKCLSAAAGQASVATAKARVRAKHNHVRRLVDAGAGVGVASKLLGVEVTRELYDLPGDKVPAELQDKARALLAERGRSLVYETEVHPPLDSVRASSLPSSLGMLQDIMWGWGDYHRPG